MTSKIQMGKTTVIMYVILICTILNGSVMWRFIVGTPLNFMVLIIMQYVSCICGVLSYGRFIPKKCVYTACILCVYFVVYCLGTRYKPEVFLIYYAGVFIFFFMYLYQVNRNNDLEKFIRAFTNIVLVIAILSLFFWLFGSILNVLPGRIALEYNWANRTYTTYTYYGLYFENPIQSEQILFGKQSIRNSGVYAEVPGYAEILLYALTIELLTEQKKKWRFAVLLAALLSTSSTKGLLTFVIIAVVNYITKREYKQKIYQVIKFLLSAFLLVGGVFACVYILQDKSQTGSFGVRMDDIHAAIITWKSKPLFGVGYNNMQKIAVNFQVSRSSDGLSMGLTALLAQGGLYLIGLYAAAMVCAIRSVSQYRHEIVIFCIMVLINLFISNSAFSSIMIAMLAAAFSSFATKRTLIIQKWRNNE